MQNFIELLGRCSNLDNKKLELINLVFGVCSNIDDVYNKRPSHVAFLNCIKYSRNSENAIASALLSMNGDHAPFSNTYDLINKLINNIDNCEKYIKLLVDNGEKVPGFGNPIFKTKEDNEKRVASFINLLPKKYLSLRDKIEKAINKNIYANLVFYISSAAHYCGFPKTHASVLFLIPTILTYLNYYSKIYGNSIIDSRSCGSGGAGLLVLPTRKKRSVCNRPTRSNCTGSTRRKKRPDGRISGWINVSV